MLVLWLRLLAFRLRVVTVSSFMLPSTFSHTVHFLSRYCAYSHPPHVSRLSAWVSPVLSGPICPVMSSCCLSTSSLRFLRHLLPTGAFGVPCGSLTQEKPETPLGFPRSPRVRCHRGGCLLYCGEMGVLHVGFVAPTFQTSQSSPFQPVTVTVRHAASSDVHLRSPVRCFPSPVASFGLKLPWTLPLAFHPTVTSDAERDWEQALDTRLKAFASLTLCDLVSHIGIGRCLTALSPPMNRACALQ